MIMFQFDSVLLNIKYSCNVRLIALYTFSLITLISQIKICVICVICEKFT